MIFDAESPFPVNREIIALELAYPDLFASGFITVRRRSDPFQTKPGLSLKEQWQRKQSLDCAELFLSCSTLADYYLHIEDDVIATPRYLDAIRKRLDQHLTRESDWKILSFYNAHPMRDDVPYSESQLYHNYFGLIGQLIRCRDLPDLARYVSAHADQTPVDVLVGWFVSKTGGRIYPHSPALFQHVGLISSLQGRTQMWAAPEFEETLASRGRRKIRGLWDVLIYQPRSMGALAKYNVGIKGKRSRRRAVG